MGIHQPERKEKICLNCGSEIYGRYCHHCGQENVEPHESFWHLVRHFFEDVTHFDGKFFITIKDLLFKPGFLSKEYIKGKRVSYLHPIRMYVFTSFIFFFIFFLLKTKETDKEDIAKEKVFSKADLEKEKTVLQNTIPLIKDSTKREKAEEKVQGIQDKIDDLDDTVDIKPKTSHTKLTYETGNHSTIQQYDSAQNSLPKEKRDGFISRKITERGITLNQKYNNHNNKLLNDLWENFQHKIPQLLFISLPLFALILMLLFHKRKDLYYADHGIFSIHLYIAYFIFILVIVLLTLLPDSTFLDWLILGIFLLILFYSYKSLKNFYGESRSKTILKLGILWFLDLIVMVFLFIVFAIIIILTM